LKIVGRWAKFRQNDQPVNGFGVFNPWTYTIESG
jgi:hypothetical protein